MTGRYGRAAALGAAFLLSAGCRGAESGPNVDRSEKSESRDVTAVAAAAPRTAEDDEDAASNHTAKDRDESDRDEKDDDRDGRGGLRLTAAQRAEFDVVVEEAGGAKIESVLELPGEIHANASRLARLVPRFAGIVTDVRKQEGEWVEKGEVLARIESNESLSQFELRTPIAGTVIERHITAGELASAETPAFVVADLKTVWVDLSVFQKDLGQIKEGQSVRIHAEPEIGEAVGKISYIAPILSEATRTAAARVVLANPDGRWRPGLFITGVVIVGAVQAQVSVPIDAVQRWNDQSVVFVEDEEALEPRPVSLGVRDRAQVEVVSGLAPGDHFVSRGAFLLRSELQKGAFGDDDD